MANMTRAPVGNLGILAATLIVVGLASSGTARADADIDWFEEPRTDLGFGMLVGGFQVGPVGGVAVGFHLDVGRQMGPLKVYGEYNMLSIGESSTPSNDDPVRGILHRGGLNLRYTMAAFGGGRYKPIQGAFWVEGGLGHQYITWNEGGVLRRQDASFGFGAQFNFKIGRHTPKPKLFGFHYAFKATVARSPDADKMVPPTCGGPCDKPTGPSPYDFGLFFNMGLIWGR